MVWLLAHLEEWERSHSKDALSKRIDNAVVTMAKREMGMRLARERLKAHGIEWTNCPVKD